MYCSFFTAVWTVSIHWTGNTHQCLGDRTTVTNDCLWLLLHFLIWFYLLSDSVSYLVVVLFYRMIWLGRVYTISSMLETMASLPIVYSLCQSVSIVTHLLVGCCYCKLPYNWLVKVDTFVICHVIGYKSLIIFNAVIWLVHSNILLQMISVNKLQHSFGLVNNFLSC